MSDLQMLIESHEKQTHYLQTQLEALREDNRKLTLKVHEAEKETEHQKNIILRLQNKFKQAANGLQRFKNDNEKVSLIYSNIAHLIYEVIKGEF